MKTNTKSSIAFPAEELKSDIAQAKLKAKSRLKPSPWSAPAQEATERKSLGKGYCRASRATRETLANRRSSTNVGRAGQCESQAGLLYLADQPRWGTEAGKLRPVLVVQTDR
jgi:hypothetical protein